MPSPSPIPRSSSYPNISSSANRHTFVPPSNRSVSSARSTKFSYWRHWSNINQLGNLIIPGRKSSDSSSKHSDLTEESLEAHNRRHAPIIHEKFNINILNEKNAKCSPYYKGLTDSSLVINRERLVSSPGRESHATTMATSTSSSLSSLIIKMQELSSCFTFKSREDSYHAFNNSLNTTTASATTGKKHTRTASSTSTASSLTTGTAAVVVNSVNEMNSDREDADALLLLNKEKPLRERVSETSTDSPRDALLLLNKEKPLRERVSETSTDSPRDKRSAVNKDVEENKVTSTQDQEIKNEASRFINKDRVEKNDRNTQEIKNEREFTWANMYQPKTLKDFICNRDKAIQLQDLVKEGVGGNFIFEGPPGVGKRTMIWAMLREAFGPDRVQTREESKVFDLKGEAIGSIQVNIKESSKHVEVNLSDLKGYEKHVILELMKDKQSKISSKASQSNIENTRAIILCEADKLSTDALLYIRWLLERYKGLNKFFFCCSDVSKLQPIKSLCTVIKLFPSSKEEIVEVLEFIAKQEGIEMSHNLAEKIAENSKNNLRQAIRSFEASWRRNYRFTEDQVILTGWEDDITNIAMKIVEEQSPKQLYTIRGKLQNLIEHDVSLHFIFKSLVEELKKHLDVGLHRQIDSLYDEYNMDYGGIFDNKKPFLLARSRYEEMDKSLNDPTRKNVQHFLRIEEFIAKFMSWYKVKVMNHRSCEEQDATGP